MLMMTCVLFRLSVIVVANIKLSSVDLILAHRLYLAHKELEDGRLSDSIGADDGDTRVHVHTEINVLEQHLLTV